MNIRTLLISILWINLLGLIFRLIFQDGTEVYTSISVVLSTLAYLGAMLFIASYKFNNRLDDLVTLLVILSILWIVFRSVHLALDVRNMNYQYLIEADTGYYTFSMIMILLSTLFLYAGLVLGFKIYKTSSEKSYDPNIRLSFVKIYFLIMLLNSLLFHFTGIAEYGNSKIAGIINIALSWRFILPLLIILYIQKWTELNSNLKIQAYALLLLYIIVRVLGGSKGGIFELGLTAVFCFVAVMKTSEFNVSRKYLLMGGGLLIMALFLFYLGHGMRLFLATNIGNEINFKLITSNYIAIYEYAVYSIDNYGGYYEMISRRLSMFDYLYVMFNKEPVEQFISIGYQVKVMLNTLLPGVPFPDSILMSALLFKPAFGYTTYSDVLWNYHSDMLPVFGWSYINMGAFSLLFLFVVGISISMTYKHLLGIQTRFNYFYRALFLLYVGEFIFGMGFDNLFQRLLFHTLLPLILFRVALYISEHLTFKKHHKTLIKGRY
jgi:hypothetical protein